MTYEELQALREKHTPKFLGEGWWGEMVISRRKARLLAKRINQMLDQTK